MAEHVFQHLDSPTWCVNCGRFDLYCKGECDGAATRTFDSCVPANWDRMYEECFGAGAAEQGESI